MSTIAQYKEACNKLADSLEAHKCDLFATYNSIDQLITDQNISGEQVAHIMMAVNTTLQMAANQVRKG